MTKPGGNPLGLFALLMGAALVVLFALSQTAWGGNLLFSTRGSTRSS